MNVRLRQPEQKSFIAAGLAALSELLFLLTFAAYLVFLTLNSTMFKPELPGRFRDLLLIALFMTGSLKLALQLAAENSDNRKNFVKHILAALLAAVMWLLVYRNDRYKFLLFLAVLTAAFVGTDYRKALKVVVVSVGTVVLSAVLCSFSGSIPNLVYDDTIRLRSSWGIGYPTDFSAYLLFLSLIAWVAWKDLPDLFFLLPGVLSLVVAKVITGTNTDVICCILFLAAVVLSAVLRDQQHRVLDKLIHLASAVSFPLLAVMMVAMTWAYHEGNAFAQKLDIWNHSRLSLASSIYDEVGLSLFGSPFKQLGFGKSVLGNTEYHFVDCSYLLILLRYGVATLLVLALLWVLMTFAVAKLRDRRLLLVFMVIAVHCVSEHHYTDLNYNPFLVLPFSLLLTASLPSSAQVPEKQTALQKWTRAGLLLAVSSALVLALIWAFPRFTTLCTFFDLGSSVRRRRLLFAAVFTGLLLLLLFADACTRLLAAAAEKKKAGKSLALLAGVLAVFFLGGLLASNTLLDRAEKKYHDMLESERPAVEAVQRAGCSLLVDNLPELYRRTFGSIDRSLFHGEDLARQKNLAVITDADRELNVLINRGFLYGEISDDQAVYTDSAEAIGALQAAGYHLHGYYSRDRELNLNEISWAAYGEPLREEGTINLSECGPIENNVKTNLFGASYRVSYTLRLEAESAALLTPDAPVAALRVVCYPEDTLVAERDVLLSEFREDGTCLAAIDFSVPNVYETEFLILPKPFDGTLLLQRISYQRIQQ